MSISKKKNVLNTNHPSVLGYSPTVVNSSTISTDTHYCSIKHISKTSLCKSQGIGTPNVIFWWRIIKVQYVLLSTFVNSNTHFVSLCEHPESTDSLESERDNLIVGAMTADSIDKHRKWGPRNNGVCTAWLTFPVQAVWKVNINVSFL